MKHLNFNISVSQTSFLHTNLFNTDFKKYLCLAALGLRCHTWAFSSCGKQGLLCSCCAYGLLIGVASPVVEHRLQERRLSSCCIRAHGLSSCDSRVPECRLVVGHRASFPEACGISPYQVSNQCTLQ